MAPPWKKGECKCLQRALERDPIPEYLQPIYPPHESPGARPVHTSTSWLTEVSDRQIAMTLMARGWLEDRDKEPVAMIPFGDQ
jgi:hypothetical protein